MDLIDNSEEPALSDYPDSRRPPDITNSPRLADFDVARDRSIGRRTQKQKGVIFSITPC
jgi:hypothetical protein